MKDINDLEEASIKEQKGIITYRRYSSEQTSIIYNLQGGNTTKHINENK